MIRILTLIICLCMFPSIAAAKSSEVKLGIDNIDSYSDIFSGKRVGLITNPTGVNSKLESTIDILKKKTNLVALFSPEHGIRGNITAGEKVGQLVDKKTGLAVYSLYGDSKKPTPEMLEDIDILCFDIQDIGVRFYTYMSTMAYAMEACRENNKTFVVFDRPNPLGGEEVEGPVIKPGFESFIGLYPIPVRHGLTIGELASLFNTEYGINCNLIVVKMDNWQRSMYWENTGLVWVRTSPNIPTPDSALLFCGTGIFGATNLSEGIGTTLPFELVGAEWLDGQKTADIMNGLKLPGVVFRPTGFTPQFGRFIGVNCNGVQIHVLDRKIYKPFQTAAVLLKTIEENNKSKFIYSDRGFDIEIGESNFRENNGIHLDSLFNRWNAEAANFKKASWKYYLYD